jgi:two-component system phosphate regulon sensor histidine kinase PhoR
MLPLSTRLIVISVITGTFSWLFGEIFGTWAGWISAVLILSLLLIHQLWHATKFTKLLMSPSYGEVPGALGIWGEIYYRLHKMVKSSRDKVLEVEQQHHRFIQAIQASPNGVIMLNEDDQIEWCNAIAEKHFGISARRDAMQRVTHIIRKPGFVQYISRQNFRQPVRLTGVGTYEEYALDVQIFPYGDKQKLVLSQDVTQLEKTDSMRRDFVANVSHELKTPLTVLSGFLETVSELDLDKADEDRYLNLMGIQVNRMKSLVDDLLTLAKIEGNPEPPSKNVVEIKELLKRLKLDAEGLSQGRHTIVVDCLTDKTVTGDESDLYSAYSNLVFNAIRYTPANGIVKILWEDVPGGGVQLSVIDTGPGISEEHLPRLTERFYRVDRSRSRETGGTGLGLAIVKHIATRHQSDLKIASVLGQGSTFSFVMPKHRVVEALVR